MAKPLSWEEYTRILNGDLPCELCGQTLPKVDKDSTEIDPDRTSGAV